MTFFAVICLLLSWVCIFTSGWMFARRKRSNVDVLEDLYQAARLIKDDPERAEVELIKRVEEFDRLKEQPVKLPWYTDFKHFVNYVLFAEYGIQRNPNPALIKVRSMFWDVFVAMPLFVLSIPLVPLMGPVLILLDRLQEKR